MAANVPPTYEPRPPDWVPPAHGSAKLGHLGFDDPVSGYKEEVMTRNIIRDGYSAEVFPAESFSAQDMVHTNDTGLHDLENLLNRVISRRTQDASVVLQSNFRLPSRVTLNDTKRQAWFSDLANPEVPLNKLGKSVPHGAKGGDLLDLLYTHNVPVPRAIWFLRVFGANETAAIRIKANYNPTAYSVEWAGVVTAHLKKQLSELALPAAPKLSLNVKSTFKGVLTEADTRDRWVARFTYFLAVLRLTYDDGLVDKRTFLLWLTQQLGIANLAQVAFVADVAHDYCADLLVTRALAHELAQVAMSRLVEVVAQNMPELDFLKESLVELLKRVCVAMPDALVSPRLWYDNDELVQQFFAAAPSISAMQANATEIVWSVPNAGEVDERVRNLLFLNEPPSSRSRLAIAVSIVHRLNRLTASYSSAQWAALLDEVFATESGDDAEFVAGLHILLSWATSPAQYGAHRPFVVLRLLKEWLAATTISSTHSSSWTRQPLRHDVLQNALFDWLDIKPDPVRTPGGEHPSQQAIAVLFGKLVHAGLFSFSSYLQRLLARNEPLSATNSTPSSRHRNFVRDIPLLEISSSLNYQRKMTLYGLHSKATPEESNERLIKSELRTALPRLFEDTSSFEHDNLEGMLQACPSLLHSRPFEQVRILHSWFTPGLIKQVERGHVSPTTFIVSISMLERFGCLECVFEVICRLLERYADNIVMVEMALALFEPHLHAWECLDLLGRLTQLLYQVHQYVKTTKSSSRCLLNFLLLDIIRENLNEENRSQILADVEAANSPVGNAGITLHDASAWNQDSQSLCWTWDQVFHDVCLAPMPIDPVLSAQRLRQAVETLVHAHQQAPDVLDLTAWAARSEDHMAYIITRESWMMFMSLLVHACARRIVHVSDVLGIFVYQKWKLAVECGDDVNTIPRAALQASFRLFKALIVDANINTATDDGSAEPCASVSNAHLRAARVSVFLGHNFVALLRGLTDLSVLRENGLSVDEQHSAEDVWFAMSKLEIFHQALYVVLSHNNLQEEAQEDALHASGAHSLAWHAEGNLALIALPGVDVLVGLRSLPAHSSDPWIWILRLFAATVEMHNAFYKGPCLQTLVDVVTSELRSCGEMDIIEEWAMDITSDAAKKFIDSGLRHLSNALHSRDMSLVESSVSSMLRFLSNMVASMRERNVPISDVPSEVQDTLWATMSTHLISLNDALESGTDVEQSTEHIILLARLLQFNLGLGHIWTPGTTATSVMTLSTVLFKLVLYYGGSLYQDDVVYALLLDTLYYFMDEAVIGIKFSDVLALYPQMPLSELPLLMSETNRKKMRALMPFLDAHPSVEGLVTSSKGSSKGNGMDEPVLNRPWEWTEYLGDGATPEADDESVRKLVKNTAALSLDLFDAHGTGEVLPGVVREGDSAALTTFYDSLTTESVYARSWRDARSATADSSVPPPRSAVDVEGHEPPAWLASQYPGRTPYTSQPLVGGSRPGSRGTSPASSTYSRTPFLPSGSGPVRVSPVHGNFAGTPQGAITPGGSRRPNKRKAPQAVDLDDDDDDDIIILDAPPVPSTSHNTRPQPRPVGKRR